MKTTWKYVHITKLKAETPPGQLPGLSVRVPGNAEKFCVLDQNSQDKSWIWLGNKAGGSVIVVPTFELKPSNPSVRDNFLMDETIKILAAGIPLARIKELTILSQFVHDTSVHLGMYVEMND